METSILAVHPSSTTLAHYSVINVNSKNRRCDAPVANATTTRKHDGSFELLS